MTGFLDHLVGRTLGTVPILRPRLRALFEPGPGERWADTVSFNEVAVTDDPRRPDKPLVPPADAGDQRIPVLTSDDPSRRDDSALAGPVSQGYVQGSRPAKQDLAATGVDLPDPELRSPVVPGPVVAGPVPPPPDGDIPLAKGSGVDPLARLLPAVALSAAEPDEAYATRRGAAEATMQPEGAMGRLLDTDVPDGSDRSDSTTAREGSTDPASEAGTGGRSGRARSRTRHADALGRPAEPLDALEADNEVMPTSKARRGTRVRRPSTEGERPPPVAAHEIPPSEPSPPPSEPSAPPSEPSAPPTPSALRSSPRSGQVAAAVAIAAQRNAGVRSAPEAGAGTEVVAPDRPGPPAAGSVRSQTAAQPRITSRRAVLSQNVAVIPPSSTAEPPRVSVHIGRVVVANAAPAAEPSPMQASPAPAVPVAPAPDRLSLEEYLKRRDGGSS